jgi:hypothetical protein
MSLRTLGLSFLVAVTASLACGGGGSSGPNEPTTAKEKQRQDAQAKGDAPADEPGGKWKGWRYAGDRDECFFVVGHRCFKSEAAACKFAKCGGKCEVTGGGPATVACAAAR